jgi:hypothetical protein
MQKTGVNHLIIDTHGDKSTHESLQTRTGCASSRLATAIFLLYRHGVGSRWDRY